MQVRTRKDQLSRLLGELGTLEHVKAIDGQHPAPGWYLHLTAKAAKQLDGSVWRVSDTCVYAGYDTPAAAIMISRLVNHA